ncbi:SDR family NAD(P)-dependent oxidoreductase [Advenella mimigardefordensis]|uniref:Putative oxidoreductase, SDR family n=1 Tax=Advenella mimigardefordensis (strain DSM 17166 / LMG 22922 / DPN7) TaxID=1247726 RepID=W0PGB0_ADVMD|nr:SDR family oxidoreductase [Advenella mimigardefordensis]AHG64612.1 putative oxidoreductase, SDR family [Advenella mimigardefordensis DPN7]
MNYPDFHLAGKVAIVTGAAQGIGRAIALGLANAGANVAIMDKDAEALAHVKSEIENLDQQALSFALNLENTEAISTVIQDTFSHYGQLDILVNNAGVRVHKRVLEHTLDDWHHTLNVNCAAPLLACQAAAKIMREHGGGSIINIASQMAEVTSPFRVAYCASKAALVQMTRVMAVDWAEYGIRVNAVAPGPTRTPFTTAATESGSMPVSIEKVPLRRIADSEEMIGAVQYLASSASHFVTGSVLVVDGGQSIYWR